MLGSALAWDALLFDFDGVLADSEPVHHSAWNQTLESLGIHLDWEDYRKHFVGIPDEIALRERLGIQAGGEALVAQKQELFRQGLAAAQPFLPDTVQLLQDLFPSYKMAVVSSSYRSEVEPPLVRGGIRPFFQLLICGDDVKHFKPSPEPYLLAAERLGARRPLVIEDSEAGVASGRAAGFEVLQVSRVEDVAREVREYLRRG
ncbi:MAG TPA: HAD family phosphatase [Bryobacteraceae bacterium]|nr:HAD family phosphatase [Bryobacteraceae bacterium]